MTRIQCPFSGITIQIDSREKPRAIKQILAEFDKQGIRCFVSKLYVGDYCAMQNPLLLIDRKQNIAEMAQNAASGHDRVKRELERLDEMGGRMVFLIEQSKIGKQPIKSIEDIARWTPERGIVKGETVYKILASWQKKHNIAFVFCSKKNTGKEIIRILTEGIGNG